MSHPQSNNIMLVGIVLSLSSVILFGLDNTYIKENAFTAMCNVRQPPGGVFLLILPFLLTGSCLVSLTWVFSILRGYVHENMVLPPAPHTE